MHCLIRSLFVSIASSAFAIAQSLAGTVVTTSGTPVVGAAVTLSGTVFSAVTNAAGQFTILGLQNRSYTVQIDPLANPLAPVEFSRTVAGATNLGNYVLQPGAIVTATFTDPLGVPLSQVNCNVYLPDGTKLFTPRDITNAAGFVSFNVPQTAVTLEALPPAGSTLYPWRLAATPTSQLDLGSVAFRQGYTITGSVVRAGTTPLPVSNCEIVVTDQLTNEVMALTNNRTNSLGAFTAQLPYGLYLFEFVPAVGSAYAARELYGIPVLNASVNMGIVGLQPAVALSGVFTGPTGPIVGADIDVYDALGHKLFTPRDNTTSTGAFSIMVPAGGTYSVRVDPPVPTGIVGYRSAPVAVPVATSIGTVALPQGITVMLDMFDSTGAPLVGAVMNLVDPVTQQEVVVPGNSTDATGRMTAVVPFGLYDVTLQPRQGSRAASFAFPGVPFVAPFAVAVPLPDRPVSTTLSGMSILGVPNGGDILIDWAFENRLPSVVNATVEAVVALDSGLDAPWIPQIPIDLPPSIGFGLQLWLPTPPLPASELGFLQKFTVRLRDAATQQLLDESYVYYQPR